MRAILGIVTGTLLTIVLTTSVLADAPIALIEPAPGQTLLEPPKQVRIFFKEPVEGEFLEVYDGQQNRVDEDNAEVKPPMPPTSTMDIKHEAVYTASLRQEAIAEGMYTVAFSVMSVDGHSVGDTYEFRIGEVAEQQSSQSSPKEGAEQERSQQESEAPPDKAIRDGATSGDLRRYSPSNHTSARNGGITASAQIK